ncbi:hypothetical protein V6N11_049873 [Hibiscus sabdariffa]|uniref:Uncharacterized protein n=1 Tax=Hibiscus sabdariffa TaxID=183260 RepID=A0ABR2T886_9ROSI
MSMNWFCRFEMRVLFIECKLSSNGTHMKSIRNLNNKKVLHMKHAVPMASPLLNASFEGFILPSFPNLTQMITNGVNHSIDYCEFTTQPIDKAIPLIGDPILI